MTSLKAIAQILLTQSSAGEGSGCCFEQAQGHHQSLECQGGIFSAQAAAVFMAHPYAQDAVKLRIWDDQAKVPNLPTPDLAHFMPLVQSCQ